MDRYPPTILEVLCPWCEQWTSAYRPRCGFCGHDPHVPREECGCTGCRVMRAYLRSMSARRLNRRLVREIESILARKERVR